MDLMRKKYELENENNLMAIEDYLSFALQCSRNLSLNTIEL